MARRQHTPNVGVLEDLLQIAPGERAANGSLKMLAPAIITAKPQARKRFGEEDMADLRESIAETRRDGLGIESSGILQPLTVRRATRTEEEATGTPYVLIAGERRLRAARALSLEEVPVIIVERIENEAGRVLQLIENLQRRDLQPLEEAHGLSELKAAQGLSIRDLATKIGKGKGWVEARLALLDCGTDVQTLSENRPDTLSIAREIDGVKEPVLRAKLIEAASNGAAVREIRRRIEEAKMPSTVLTSRHLASSSIVPPDKKAPPKALNGPLEGSDNLGNQRANLEVRSPESSDSIQANDNTTLDSRSQTDYSALVLLLQKAADVLADLTEITPQTSVEVRTQLKKQDSQLLERVFGLSHSLQNLIEGSGSTKSHT